MPRPALFPFATFAASLAMRPGRPALVALGVVLGLLLGGPAAQAEARATAAKARPQAKGPGHTATQPGHGHVFQGPASYYAHAFTGRRTANGERYEPQALTMAHRLLPFGAWVRVTNLHNQASVVVRVNDRGPFTGRRVADLSHAAAQRLRMVAAGVVQARFEVLAGPPSALPTTEQTLDRTAAARTVATTAGDAIGDAPHSAGGDAEIGATAPAAGG